MVKNRGPKTGLFFELFCKFIIKYKIKCKKYRKINEKIQYIVVENSAEAAGIMAHNFYGQLTEKIKLSKTDEQQMIFAGYALLFDPPKPGVIDVIHELQKIFLTKQIQANPLSIE